MRQNFEITITDEGWVTAFQIGDVGLRRSFKRETVFAEKGKLYRQVVRYENIEWQSFEVVDGSLLCKGTAEVVTKTKKVSEKWTKSFVANAEQSSGVPGRL